MEKFSREKHILLIELVKHNPAIYNPSYEFYKCLSVKQKCWEDISVKIGASVSECKKRWKSLRDQYIKKQRDAKSGVQPNAVTSWELAPMMSFIAGYNPSQKNDSSLENSTTHSDNDTQDASLGEYYVKNEIHDPLEEEPDDDFEVSNLEYDEEEDEINDTTIPNKKTNCVEVAPDLIKRKRKYSEILLDNRTQEKNEECIETKKTDIDKLLEIFNKIESQRAFMLEKLVEKSTVKTPMRMFFESMAIIAEGFPNKVQAEIRQKVCDFISEAQIAIDNKLLTDASTSTS